MKDSKYLGFSLLGPRSGVGSETIETGRGPLDRKVGVTVSFPEEFVITLMSGQEWAEIVKEKIL